MRFCIADPPYLGVAHTYYGEGASQRRNGNYRIQTTEHPDAAEWDNPQTHIDLYQRLVNDYDGFAIASNQHAIPVYASVMDSQTRIAVWHAPNYIGTRHRVHRKWEPLFYRTPNHRELQPGEPWVSDVLTANVTARGHIGSKPTAWTAWVCDLLGVTNGDTVDDLFPGSHAVTNHLQQVRFTWNT